MSEYLIDVPVPSMGATVSELTIIDFAVAAGTVVTKGQKLAELESDKSSFEFEAPADGTIVEVKGAKGAVVKSGDPLIRMRTTDASVRHLEVASARPEAAAGGPATTRAAQWTPRALKLAQEAGLDPAKISDIEATGPGGRVSGDDVTKYVAARKN